MNRVVLVGRLAKEPELFEVGEGVCVCHFTVACSRRYLQKGERQADFIRCIAWRQNAEFVSRYFAKGNRIALEGSICTRSWQEADGTRRYATEVVADHVEFAQSKQESGQTPSERCAELSPEAAAADCGGFVPLEDEDLPF